MKRKLLAALLLFATACAGSGQETLKAALPDAPGRMAQRGDEYVQKGNLKEAKHRYELALKTLMQTDDQRRIAPLFLRLARVALLERDLATARVYADSAQRSVEKEGYGELGADVAACQASLLVAAGNAAEAMKLLQSQKASPDDNGKLANALGQTAQAQGDTKAARAYFELALSAAEKAKDPAAESAARANLAQALLRQNDPDGALAHLKRALELDKQAEASLAIGETLHLTGMAYEEKKDYANAEYFYRRALMVNTQTDLAERAEADRVAVARTEQLQQPAPAPETR